ncbi:FecR domain-containing protein [Xanthomarina sp. F1114]|uniref:FecR family protein n=1 Tax=Xanthomarina sp. F1114 TaxID=2996019 RepID=UPI00225E13A4|nr:FecR family protein [Xanthomarina sp. F1114]MCX7548689.1 FecR domain-containing protein [Xanthomarina sp. F1114]
MEEKLLKKWLQDDLSPEELIEFQALDGYESLIKLNESLKKFKAPEFDEPAILENISKTIGDKTEVKKKTNWLKPVLQIAALLAISFSVYYFSTDSTTNISTLATEKTTIELPDQSVVTLNSLSDISYNKRSWKNNRSLTLDGEAFFKVEKGSTFKVETSTGTITVLGTQFVVKNRENLFEVVCYEGSVEVITDKNTKILKPKDQYLILDNKFMVTKSHDATEPAWMHNESEFSSMPYKYVLKELERQYQVSIDINNIDTSILFTGHFVHNNLDLALKAITLPLNISYSKEDSLIVLYAK